MPLCYQGPVGIAVPILLVLFAFSGDVLADLPVVGPIVKAHSTAEEDVITHDVDLSADTAAHTDTLDDESKVQSKETIAEYLDKQLQDEFRNEEMASLVKSDLNETLSKEKGAHIEQVVKVSTKKAKQNSTEDTEEVSFEHDSTASSWDSDPEGTGVTGGGSNDREPEVEQDVDRLIDSDSNEYVLSRSKGGYVLTLDPLLIQDLTVVMATSSVLGGFFEAIKQPVLNGYIIAGSIVGPGGLGWVKEMVQVESLAQVGVQLLLFGLGIEFSIEKMQEVGSVAMVGGFIQIVLMITVCALGALAIGGALSEGIFVGALVSMSSTSVVVKSMGDKASDRACQIVLGTLILQDCSVGLMFALMPVLSSLNDPKSGLDPEATGEIVLLILKVLMKLALTLAATAVLSKSIVPFLVQHIKRHYSDELFQIAMIGYCLSCAWICGKLGLSHELGAFLAGIMANSMEHHCSSLVQVRNVFVGLFLASIGLVISPVFILEHIRLLSAGAAVVLTIKGLLIAFVVWNFRYSWTTSLYVGLSLAQVGEFAFVLLSLASQLGLVSSRLSMLLLGVTAFSLLTTPLVLNICSHFVPREALPVLGSSSSGKKVGSCDRNKSLLPESGRSNSAPMEASTVKSRTSRPHPAAEHVEDEGSRSPWAGDGPDGKADILADACTDAVQLRREELTLDLIVPQTRSCSRRGTGVAGDDLDGVT